jgi:UDP-N-acetylmuramate dehydrogenase
VTALLTDLRSAFGERVSTDTPLAPMTTFKVGGCADLLLETRSADELVRALALADRCGVPVTLLGGGSNVLVSDKGVRGLVIRPRGGSVALVGERAVRADAPVAINGLVRWTINRGHQGLEAWAGTPGTVGGAIHGNAHFRGVNIGETVECVGVARRDGTTIVAGAREMELAYDTSRVKKTGEVVLWADFKVTPGADPSVLRDVARASLAFRKRTQPLESPSAGCIFMNPDRMRDRVPGDIPASAGALIDRAGLKGARRGDAVVSSTHANFIISAGHATAADIRALIETCQGEVRRQFGVELREEIVYLGEWVDHV